MQLGKAEQDSMEVDNLCNRLVDELHSVSGQPGSLDLEEESLLSAPARGSVQVEAVVERRVEETEAGGEAIVEQRLVRVESFGEVQDEEMENALNVGKEMLLAHSGPAPTSSSTSIITATSSSSSSSSTASVSSGASQTQARPTHERRPSASKIPRFHKRSNSREEKGVSVDGIPGDVNQSSAASPSSSSWVSEGGKAAVGSKSRDEQSKALTPRASKIPLSQKMPSPTSSFREPRASKSATSPSSPRPAAATTTTTITPPSSASKSPSHAKTQPSPVPRARTSIHKSDHVAPPAEEVVEIARPSVKKRTSLNNKGDRNAAAATARDASRGDKNVIVQELKMDKGDAKLVIEKQPSLKKKIQTVHARKVPHPPRQVAEALDTDTCDSPPAELSSTGPSDMEHSGMSSQEDEVFSDESLRLGAGRDRSYSSGTGMASPRLRRRQPPSPSPLLDHRSETYQQMAASRSSLDDSVLQLAAERHDDLVPHWDGSEGGGYSTGSLRSRRSLKMRHLMEVFERGGAASNSSEDSGEARAKDRSDSTSGSTTISLGSQEREPDTDDDLFQPPSSPRLPSSSCPSSSSSSLAARRSRSRERGSRNGNQASPRRRPSQSPAARRPSSGRAEDSVLRRRRPSPLGRNSADECPRTAASRAEGGVGFGRPPRYRSASRGRTYSDSSTSESDNTQHLDGGRAGGALDSPSRPRGLPRGRAGRAEEGAGGQGQGRREESQEEAEDGVQRRGSIKELRQLFEQGSKDEGKDSGSEMSPSIPVRRSIRPRSVSPAAEGSSLSPSAMASVMRRSLEIPSSSTPSSVLKQRENPLASQPLRLGPKPFYGSKK